MPSDQRDFNWWVEHWHPILQVIADEIGLDMLWLEDINGMMYLRGRLGSTEVQGSCGIPIKNIGVTHVVCAELLIQNITNISGRMREAIREIVCDMCGGQGRHKDDCQMIQRVWRES